jgi:hypothetical protein
MLKTLAMLGVLAALTISDPGKEVNRTDFAQYRSENLALPALALPIDKDTAGPNAQPAEPQSPHWYASPEWWLCILGVPTLIFIGWQAKATADSAKVMQRSIEVQEAEFVQWLDIGEWKIEYDRSKHQLGRSGHQASHHPPGPMEVRLSFPLLNNTTRPLYINSVKTILTIGPEKDVKTFVTEEHISAPPKDEYRVVIDTTISEDQITQYVAFALFVEAVVHVQFLNALKKPDEAQFLRLTYFNVFDGNETVSKGHVAKQV